MSETGQGARVLVVDDDPGHRLLVRTILEQAGHAVTEAPSGEEAVEAARQERPALVVLDVNMPGGVSGYEVCRAVRADFGPAVPVLFLSGTRTESYDRVAGLMLGGDDYMVKPFEPDELLERARQLLAQADGAGPPRSPLTKRELEILKLLADGLDQAEIAAQLVISPKTVGTHIEHILEKLRVRSRAQAVAIAYRDDLLGTPA